MSLLKNKGVGRAKAGVGVLGAAATAKRMVDVVREVSFEDVRLDAERHPRLLVLAPNSEEATRIARLVTGQELLTGVDIGTIDADVWNVKSYDAVIVQDPDRLTGDRFRPTADHEGWQPAIVVSQQPFDLAEANRARHDISAFLGDRAIAVARVYPAFRGPVINDIVQENSTANAQFSFVSNIPSLIPGIGGLLSAGADTIVLTKNQLMMVYKIAASSGRKLDDEHAIFREMIPVVGQGFLWRTVAREATSMLPFAAGTVPKVAIAYSGTYALGKAAEFYYRFGKKPTKDQREAFAQQAKDLMAKLPFGKDANKSASGKATIVEVSEVKPTDIPTSPSAPITPQA